MGDSTLQYESRKPMQVHRGADGVLRIDIAPMGLAPALRVFTKVRSDRGAVILLCFAAFCMIVPLGIAACIYVVGRKTEILPFCLMGPVAIVFMVGLLAYMVMHRARERANLEIAPERLRIEQQGIGDTKRLDVSRDRIESVVVGKWDFEQHEMALLVKCRDEKVRHFLEHLPEEQLREIAETIRREMGLAVA